MVADTPGAYRQELEAYANEAIMAKLADGTRKGYDVGWRQWCDWRGCQGLSPFLEGETRDAIRKDEDALLLFVAFLSKIMKRAEGTIRQKLFANKFAHMAAGFPDPLQRRARPWVALAGIKRWQGAPIRRHPIMPDQLA